MVRRWARGVGGLSTIAVIMVMALAGCSISVSPGEPAPPAVPVAPTTPAGTLPTGLTSVVDRVVDGDTIVLEGGERVRLIGVDTPETKDPRKPVQCFGQQASDFTSSLLPPGTTVHLVADVEQRDNFDRLLAYVYRMPDGLFVNAELVTRGFAQVLTVPPNVAHAEELVALARAARESGIGLWSACGLP